MDEEDSKKPTDLLSEVEREDLDAWSVDALAERVTRLQAEIERSEKAIKARQSSRAAAEALFS